MQVASYFDRFTDARFGMDAAAVVGGLVVADFAGDYLNDFELGGFDLPGEAAPAAVIVGAEFAPVKGRMQRHIQLGAMAALIGLLLERAGVEVL